MSKVSRIGIIGRTSAELCDGQTIKTRVLLEELKDCYQECEIIVAETYNYKKHPWKTFTGLLRCMKKSQVVFVLLSRNGMRVIFPIINFLNKFYKKPILHDCIGGSIDELVKKHKGLKTQLNAFNVNWVESSRLKERLEDLGVHNVEYLPNFKRLIPMSEEELQPNDQAPFRFCTFSRVNEAKGVGRAAEAIIQANIKAGKIVATLDVYGPIEDNYGDMLYNYIAQSEGAVKYRGIAEANESVKVLKDYYALLFPTTFEGEGFPGTLIDALNAGLPVIATDWHCNSEIITHGYTGYIYSVNKQEHLQQLIENSISDSQAFFQMRKNCLREAVKYDADKVMHIICEKIEQVISKSTEEI